MTNNLSSKGPGLVAKMMVSNSKINSGACRLPLAWWRGRDGAMQNRPATRHRGEWRGATTSPGVMNSLLNSPAGKGVRQSLLHCTEQRTQAFIFHTEKTVDSSLNSIMEESGMTIL